MTAKKLLLVINHIDWFWSHRIDLANAAKEQGYDVHVAVPGADSKLKEHGFTGHDLPSSPLPMMMRLRTVLHKECPDITHAITLKTAFLTGLAALTSKHTKPVYTLAGLGYLFRGEGLKAKLLRFFISPLLKLAFKNARLIFQNPDDMDLLIKRGFADAQQCTLIRGSGVDLSQFTPAPLPQEDTPIVLMPTRLVHEKGVAIFIEAANILRSKNVKARLQIAGGISCSNPNAISESEMNAMLDGSAAQWLGKVSDMPALYEQATLICYPSYYGEGVPKVLLEGAACARPIITTDHPGCREVVRDGENGLLVPIKDAAATADAIETLLKDRKALEAMARASRTLAENDFDVRSVNARTLQVYEP